MTSVGHTMWKRTLYVLQPFDAGIQGANRLTIYLGGPNQGGIPGVQSGLRSNFRDQNGVATMISV